MVVFPTPPFPEVTTTTQPSLPLLPPPAPADAVDSCLHVVLPPPVLMPAGLILHSNGMGWGGVEWDEREVRVRRLVVLREEEWEGARFVAWPSSVAKHRPLPRRSASRCRCTLKKKETLL